MLTRDTLNGHTLNGDMLNRDMLNRDMLKRDCEVDTHSTTEPITDLSAM